MGIISIAFDHNKTVIETLKANGFVRKTVCQEKRLFIILNQQEQYR